MTSRPQWSNLTSGVVGALVGAAVSGVIAFQLQGSASDLDREVAVKEARRPVYLEYLRATSAWVVAQETRSEECMPGTDRPRIEGGVCSVGYLTDLQAARYDLRTAGNEMSLLESPTMGRLRTLMGSSFPSAAPRDEGPEEGQVADFYDELYVILLDYARCDTNPGLETSSDECTSLEDDMEELVTNAGLRDD